MPFRDVAGHRRIVELLSRSIVRDTLPPSLIFAGPEPSLRRQTAIAVAQLLNCLTPRADNDACGECVSCVRIARGLHPDVVVVEPVEVNSATKKVDQIREATEAATYRPFEGRRRVVIFDDAVGFGVVAQNALLKTLEEPTPASVFVLITTQPDLLLPTVRSRCVKLTFSEGAAPQIDEEARGVAVRVLSHAATSSDGSRLDAAKDLLTNTVSTTAADREQVNAHLQAMASLLRDIEILATRADSPLGNPDLKATLERLVPAYGGERGTRSFAAIDRALTAVASNVGVKIVADWVVLQL